ncbi:MAG: choice-of-anchor E domain-containing protein [Pseudomonadota bacterium]
MKHVLFSLSFLIVLTALPAKADTIVQGPLAQFTQPAGTGFLIDDGALSPISVFTIDGFDPAFGILNAVTLTTTSAYGASQGVSGVAGNEFNQAELSIDNVLSLSGTELFAPQSEVITRGASGDFGFALTEFDQGVPPTQNALTITDGAALALFTGNGPLSLEQRFRFNVNPLAGTGTWSLGTPVTYFREVTVEYEFTPTVPIPAAGPLLLAGLIVVVGLRRASAGHMFG